MTARTRVTAVCVTTAVQPRTSSTTTPSGINKGPVDLAVLTTTGVVGDKVLVSPALRASVDHALSAARI